MSAAALLAKTPQPSDAQIHEAMDGILCRCGTYPAIERAILAASDFIQRGTPFSTETLPAPETTPGKVGKHLVRPDAVQKVTGVANYTDDLYFEGMLIGRVKRAGVPHGMLRNIDISRAKTVPGVRAVLTAEDLPGAQNHGLVRPDWPILVGVGGHIRYVGDAVAILAADTDDIAAQALEFISVEIEPLPVVNTPIEALRPDAPAIHARGNLLKHIQVRKGNLQQGLDDADLVLEHVFLIPAADHLFMEPECSLARPTAEGKMEVYVGSQIPYSDREQVAKALGWPEERVRIIGQFTGGGFGGKEDIAGQIHSALLARATNKPVKLLFDRHESMLVHPKRHYTEIRVKAGIKQDGSLTAMETELLGDTGAYASLGEKVMERATTHSTGAYEQKPILHLGGGCSWSGGCRGPGSATGNAGREPGPRAERFRQRPRKAGTHPRGENAGHHQVCALQHPGS